MVHVKMVLNTPNMSVCSPCIWLQSIDQPQALSVVGEHNYRTVNLAIQGN